MGKVVGKVKEAAGELFGQDDLAREGRLQQAQVDAEVVAETHAAEAEQLQREQQLEADKQENELERQRLRTEITAAEREAALDASSTRPNSDGDVRTARRRRSSRIDTSRGGPRHPAEQQAVAKRIAEEQEAARLERAAEGASLTADAVDPEVK